MPSPRARTILVLFAVAHLPLLLIEWLLLDGVATLHEISFDAHLIVYLVYTIAGGAWAGLASLQLAQSLAHAHAQPPPDARFVARAYWPPVAIAALGLFRYALQRAMHGSVRERLGDDMFAAQYLALLAVAQTTVVLLLLYFVALLLLWPSRAAGAAPLAAGRLPAPTNAQAGF